MDYFMKIVKESFIILIISSIMGLVSGVVLSLNEAILYSIPIFILILPAINALIGDIATIMVSRLTTHLFIGIIPPKVTVSDRLKEDLLGLLITLICGVFALLIIGYLIVFFTGMQIVNPLLISLILMLTTLILFFFLFIVLFLGSIVLFKRGRDPNNYLIPIITSLIDFLAPFLIILFITIIFI
jgi:mgtE-like transporter